MKILLTGASGMLGGYLRPILDSLGEVTTLGRSSGNIVCDLASHTPDLCEKSFALVVHAAGSSDESDAFDVNLEGTRHLLEALEKNPPKEMVYVSSWEVYSQDSGEDVEENHQRWASSKTGRSKAQAEDFVGKWCADRGVTLTIVRPARMMGKGVKGEMKRLFNDVIRNRYIHVRGNDARLSLVCAIDVAKVIAALYPIGGTYNITDGKGAKWIELAEAMSANSGAMKRQTFLPEKWASAAWRYASWIPAVKASLAPETLARRSKTLTLSDAALRNAIAEWNPFPTIDVINRSCTEYRYLDH